MSGAPQVRRADKLMVEASARETLERGFCGRLATVGKDGWPYCVPLLYVLIDGEIFVHNTRAKGHLRENVDHEPRVCFEVDEVGEVFPYGRFECDSSVAYASVVAFGRIRVVEDLTTRRRFFDALMAKYATSNCRIWLPLSRSDLHSAVQPPVNAFGNHASTTACLPRDS